MAAIFLDSRIIARGVFFALLIAMFVKGDCECAPGWTLDSRKGRCIKIFNNAVPYDTANQNCKDISAELLRMEDEDDRQFMISMPKDGNERTYLHIGMNDKAKTEEWRYENGDIVTWFAWQSGEPGEVGVDHCMVIRRSDAMRMYDCHCNNNHGYICMVTLDRYVRTGSYYIKEPSNCIMNHSVWRRYRVDVSTTQGAAKTCIVDCTSEECCSAMATNKKECILFQSDFSAVSPACMNATYELYKRLR